LHETSIIVHVDHRPTRPIGSLAWARRRDLLKSDGVFGVAEAAHHIGYAATFPRARARREGTVTRLTQASWQTCWILAWIASFADDGGPSLVIVRACSGNGSGSCVVAALMLLVPDRVGCSPVAGAQRPPWTSHTHVYRGAVCAVT
jgi:hypothetical protein